MAHLCHVCLPNTTWPMALTMCAKLFEILFRQILDNYFVINFVSWESSSLQFCEAFLSIKITKIACFNFQTIRVGAMAKVSPNLTDNLYY